MYFSYICTDILCTLSGLKLPDVPTFSPGKSKEFNEMESQSEIFIPDLNPSDKVKRSKEAA